MTSAITPCSPIRSDAQRDRHLVGVVEGCSSASPWTVRHRVFANAPLKFGIVDGGVVVRRTPLLRRPWWITDDDLDR